MSKPIYLDYMATTPVDPQVVAQMQTCLTLEGDFGNPSSDTHCYGYAAAARVAQAATEVAELINADANEIIWTSGATEANNLAIKGAAQFYQRNGKHIITVATEHHAVLDTCAALAEQGFTVTYLTPDSDGLVSEDALRDALRQDTILLSVMHVNNEIGVIQNISALAKIAKQQGVIVHCDAAQSAGKIPVDVHALGVDLLSLSAHKMYGPKGIGALYVRRKPRLHLQAQIHGGGHQQGLRSGTLPTHLIAGFGSACRLAQAQLTAEYERIALMQQDLWQRLQVLPGLQLHGHASQRVPHNLNFAVAGVNGESLLLSLKDIALSRTSACRSTGRAASHVLHAIGVDELTASRSLRLSLGRFLAAADIKIIAEHIITEVTRLREMAP